MKEHLPYIILTVAVLAVAIFAGCKLGPQRATYDTLAGAEITVDQVMQAWGAYVAQFHPPAAQEQAVADAYAKYQAAEETAIDAAQIVFSLTSTNAPGSADAQTKSAQASAAAAAAFGDLLNLVRSFGVKI
ncbi:MAG TPA: hypothetical protein VHH88_08540 [Verrucomicrobiae bacterium]|nr:hypothetical protein [Verrucomicrobiae bacterium]